MFRNVGIYISNAGELPRRKHAKYRITLVAKLRVQWSIRLYSFDLCVHNKLV